MLFSLLLQWTSCLDYFRPWTRLYHSPLPTEETALSRCGARSMDFRANEGSCSNLTHSLRNRWKGPPSCTTSHAPFFRMHSCTNRQTGMTTDRLGSFKGSSVIEVVGRRVCLCLIYLSTTKSLTILPSSGPTRVVFPPSTRV